jgi:hypothetical protein
MQFQDTCLCLAMVIRLQLYVYMYIVVQKSFVLITAVILTSPFFFLISHEKRKRKKRKSVSISIRVRMYCTYVYVQWAVHGPSAIREAPGCLSQKQKTSLAAAVVGSTGGCVLCAPGIHNTGRIHTDVANVQLIYIHVSIYTRNIGTLQ